MCSTGKACKIAQHILCHCCMRSGLKRTHVLFMVDIMCIMDACIAIII